MTGMKMVLSDMPVARSESHAPHTVSGSVASNSGFSDSKNPILQPEMPCRSIPQDLIET